MGYLKMCVLVTSEMSPGGILGLFWSSELHTVLQDSQAASEAPQILPRQ